MINKYRWDIAFWAVQCIGWGGLTYIAYLFTPNTDGYKETNFFFFLLIVTFGIGITSTGLLRWYLKANVSLDNFNTQELVKILFAVGAASLLYFGLSYATGYLKAYFDSEVVKIPEIYKEFGLGLALLNSFLTIIGWTIFYMSVKIVFKLNADRLERSELNAALKQSQLNTLKGQINPHFMFNSLNNIRGLMLEDVERSRDMLTKLSEMLRYSLTKNDVNSIALKDELEMVENYVALSKIQMEDRLQFKTEIAPDTMDQLIPPMIIQLLVENATKHGISKLKDGGTIKLRTAHQNNELLISVSNTGKLTIAKDSTQLGLKNIKQRLRLLYGDKASFTLEEVNGEVVSNIKIPLV